MATLIDGKAVSTTRRAALRDRVASIQANDLVPCLAAIGIGDDHGWAVYTRNQKKACASVGIEYQQHQLPTGSSQPDLAEYIEGLNADSSVHGIIVQSPLPDGFDEFAAHALISPDKDVEAVNPANLGLVLSGRHMVAPCTARSAVALAESHLGDLRGIDAVVVGASVIVGRPVAQLLLAAGATVSVCHIDTKDVAKYTTAADLLVVAVGKAGLITADMVKPGATVIDVGINRVKTADGVKTVGDVDPAVAEVAGGLSPVPGGVGALTTTMLLEATVDAAERLRDKPPVMAGAAVARLLGEAGANLSPRASERIAALLSAHVVGGGENLQAGNGFERRLGKRLLVLDGAMGTELIRRGIVDMPVENANIDAPDLVLVHRDYLAAGAHAITTNTFRCNRYSYQGDREQAIRVASAGVRLARQAAGGSAFILGSLGPLGPVVGADISEHTAAEAIAEIALAMVDAGVDGFMVETVPSTREAQAIMTGIRQITDLPVVVCRTFFRHDSEEIATFAKSMAQAGAAAVGTNCVGGPRSLLPIIEQLCAVSDLPVVAMPNAGFPTVQNGQTFYHLAPDYLKRYAQRFRDLGVAVIGGCCGVGAEHIAAIHEQLAGQSLVERDPQTQRLTSKTVMVRQHPFARSLQDPELFPLLAMVPGRLSDREANRALKELADAGASAVGLLAGWPGAGGSGNLTARLRRGQDASQRPAVLELPAESLSLAEAQSALYDAALLGIDTVLVDAGVFSGLAGRPGSGCDPRRLITLIADHNRGYDLQGVRLEEPTRFAIGVRLGRDDLEQAEEFAAAGAHFCTMQPIYEPQAFREAMASYDSDLPLMAEILVLSDAETADELDNEVPVLSVPKKLRERLAENPEEDVEGVLTFLRYWRGALAGAVIMLPDARTEQAVSLISQLHSTAEAP